MLLEQGKEGGKEIQSFCFDPMGCQKKMTNSLRNSVMKGQKIQILRAF